MNKIRFIIVQTHKNKKTHNKTEHCIHSGNLVQDLSIKGFDYMNIYQMNGLVSNSSKMFLSGTIWTKHNNISKKSYVN